MSPRRRWITLALVPALAFFAHAGLARTLVDHQVAGALLAGGGGVTSILAAAGFLLLRLLGFVAWSALPAVVVAKLYSSRSIVKMRGGLGLSLIHI